MTALVAQMRRFWDIPKKKGRFGFCWKISPLAAGGGACIPFTTIHKKPEQKKKTVVNPEFPIARVDSRGNLVGPSS